MKKKNYVGKAVMLGALLTPIGLPYDICVSR